MSILQLSDLDRVASHQRVPDYSTANVDDYGNQTDAYVELEANVPIRIEQPDQLEAILTQTVDAVTWIAMVLPTIANPPALNDRFVLSDRTLTVKRVEDLTQLDGTLDHYEMVCVELEVA